MQFVQTLSAPAGRFFLALIFVMSGINKISGYAATQGYMEAMGVPGLLVYPVIALEIAGGLAIIAGWLTRPTALALAAFTLIAGVIFHSNFADQMQMILFMKNVAITGGLLLLAVHGAGAFSVDTRQPAIAAH